jgi:AraC-like DNA-binding protein
MTTYREILPTQRLSRYVECYWTREDSEGTPRHCVLPDGCTDILFSACDGEPSGLVLVGLMTSPQLVDIPAGQLFFGVRFRPGMAAAFVPGAAQLNDRNEPLENVLGSTARQLLEQFAESPKPEEMARAMDTLLRPLKPSDAGQRALQQLGLMCDSIDQVARQAGLSTRQFRRLCLERAGVSPKYLCRILRFRNATQRIARLAANSSQPNWAHLAAACGYYDQAHFIREFQEFTGDTPGRYLQSLAARRS